VDLEDEDGRGWDEEDERGLVEGMANEWSWPRKWDVTAGGLREGCMLVAIAMLL